MIIVPNEHFENLYRVPDHVGERIFTASKEVAQAMKSAYNCNGITTRQNNEPAGDQHAFHYHLHIFPRYNGDMFNQELTKKSFLSDPAERIHYKNMLQSELGKI